MNLALLTAALGAGPPPPAGPPLHWRGDWLNFRFNGVVNYLGDLPARDDVCAAYRAVGYTDVLVASNLGPQPGADAPFDLFGDPAGYKARCEGFTSRGLRAIGQIGFEDNWDVWAQYAADFPRHLRNLLAAHPPLSSLCWGVEIDEGIVQSRYTWDDLIEWMVIVDESTDHLPQACWMRQTAWGPEGDTPPSDPWHGRRQTAWWTEVRRRLPSTPLAMAFQHRHDQPGHQRPNHGFLSPAQDVIDHVTALLTPERLGGLGVLFTSAEYAWNGVDPAAVIVPESDAAVLGDLALSLGATGAFNGVTVR